MGLDRMKVQVVSDQIDDLIQSNPEAAQKLMGEADGKAELHKKYMGELNKAIKTGDLNSILSIDPDITEDDINLKAYEIKSLGTLSSYIKALEVRKNTNSVKDDIAKSLLSFGISVKDKIGTYVDFDSNKDGVIDDKDEKIPWVESEGAQTLEKDLQEKLMGFGHAVTERDRAEIGETLILMQNARSGFDAIDRINFALEGGHLLSAESVKKAKDAKFFLYQGVGNDDPRFLRQGLKQYDEIWDIEVGFRNERISRIDTFRSEKASFLHRMASELEDEFGMGQSKMAEFDKAYTDGGKYSLRMDINRLFAKDKREMTPENIAESKIVMATEMSKLFEPSNKEKLKHTDRVYLKNRASKLVRSEGSQAELETIAREFVEKLSEVQLSTGGFNFDYEGTGQSDRNAQSMFKKYFDIYGEIKNADVQLRSYIQAGFPLDQGLIGANTQNTLFPPKIIQDMNTFNVDDFLMGQ